MLALVLVKTLDLDIEESRGIHLNAALIPDNTGKINLVGVLHGHELLLKDRILGIRLQPSKLIEVAFPAVANLGGDQFTEPRIAREKPSARCDAVGLVVELSGIECVEFREEIALEQLRVQRGHPVH